MTLLGALGCSSASDGGLGPSSRVRGSTATSFVWLPRPATPGTHRRPPPWSATVEDTILFNLIVLLQVYGYPPQSSQYALPTQQPPQVCDEVVSQGPAQGQRQE